MKRNNVILLPLLVLCTCTTYGQSYSITNTQGIWVIEEDISNEGRIGLGEEYYIIKGNNMLFVSSERDYLNVNVVMYKYGFSNIRNVVSVEQLNENGEFFVDAIEQDGRLIFQESPYFFVSQGKSMSLFMEECSYIERLPTKAQIVLFKRSLYDKRNYAREFLEYDICGVKNDNIHLLDSLQNETDIIIGKDDIVVVRDTAGALLQVECEPEPDKYITGYLRREDLLFVE